MSIQDLKGRGIRILRYSEQYTKTDMVYLATSGFWSLFNQGVGSLASFAVVVLLANMLPKESFGQYRFFLSIISILTLFTLPGIGTALLRSAALGQAIDLSRIAKEKIRWSLVSSVLSLFTSIYYFYVGNNLIACALLLTAAFLPFAETFYIYLAYYKGRKDFKTAAIYESISRIFQAIVLIVVVLITENVVVLVTAFFVGQIVTRYFFYEKTRKYILEQKLSENSLPDDTVSYGKNISYTIITSTIMGNLDKLIIWHFFGAEALAVYYVALTIPHNIGLLFNVIPRVALPKFSTNSWDTNERSKVIRKILIFFFLLIIPALIYSALTPYLIPFIFKDYGISVMPAFILSLVVVLMPTNALIEQVLYAQKSTTKIVVLQVLELVVFGLMSFLMYKHGVNGIAISLVGSGFFAFLAGIFIIKKNTS